MFAESENALDLNALEHLMHPHSARLPEVSLSIAELAALAPDPAIEQGRKNFSERMSRAQWLRLTWDKKGGRYEA